MSRKSRGYAARHDRDPLDLAVGSAAASAASHPRWKVASAFLGAGVEKSLTGSSVLPQSTLKGGGINLESTGCTTTGKIVGSAAGAPGSNTSASVVLSCTGVKDRREGRRDA
jgi:hypothetical protein